MHWVFYNQQLCPLDSLPGGRPDSGLLYGRGLFETMRVSAGRVMWLDQHLHRLLTSARILGLTVDFSADRLVQVIEKTVAANQVFDGAVRLTLTDSLFIQCRPLPYRAEDYRQGWRLGLVPWQRSAADPLLQHKTICCWNNLLAREEARRSGWQEALWLNTDGQVCEGTISNIFVLQNGVLRTPPLQCGLLPGVARARLMEVARREGLDVREEIIYPEHLYRAQEVWLTNSLLLLMPVSYLENRPVGGGRPGPLAAKYYVLMQQEGGY
ncbi:aminotransferase class IV [Desulfurispora thermophila]|uniref:aminotransferase class IV n=1 Tax=Desulfurispora thermophila TaxID=265470 RepID=UPI00036518C1|nr:aminotransferase class IV [Desulfurispora thermophila]